MLHQGKAPARRGPRFLRARQRLTRLVECTYGRLLAGRVRVQRQHEVFGVSFELLQLVRSDGGAHTGHDVAIAVLVGGNHVHVAFDDDDLVLLRYGAIGQIDAVDSL